MSEFGVEMMPDHELREAFTRHQQRKAAAGFAIQEAQKARKAATKAVVMVEGEMRRRGML